MSDIFVSYKAEDRRRVEPLVRALEADGFTIWWDAQIAGGAEWREDIQEHLDSARCVLVVWSKRSVGREGRFVRDEASRAQRHGTYLPVRIDRIEPPLGFGEIHAIALQGWKGRHESPAYQSLLAAIRAVMSGEAPQIAADHSGPVSRRSVLIGGGATAAAVAAVGGWVLLKPRKATAASIAVLPF